jgi:hypothetical protein
MVAAELKIASGPSYPCNYRNPVSWSVNLLQVIDKIVDHIGITL